MKRLFLLMSFVFWQCHACENPSGLKNDQENVIQKQIDLQVMKLRDAIFTGKVEQVEAAHKENVQFQHDIKARYSKDIDIINHLDKNGHTPLIIAIVNGFEDIFYKLLELGADVNMTDHHNETPLHWATRKGNVGIVQSLIGYKANLEAQDETNMTALQRAAYWGRKTVAMSLLAKGANVNAATPSGLTALMCAAFKGDREMIFLLRDYGADIKAVDKDKLTAAQWAGKQKHDEVVYFLRKYLDWSARQKNKDAARFAFFSALHDRLGANSFAHKLNHYLMQEILQDLETIDFPKMIPTKIVKEKEPKKRHCVKCVIS